MTLAGYWPLNEESGDTAYDHSGNENHGALSGATQSVQGLLGDTSYSFNGTDDYIEIDYDTGSMRNLNPDYISIQAWIYPRSISSDSENFAHTGGDGIVAKVGDTDFQEDTSATDDNYRIALGDNGKVGFYIDDGSHRELHTATIVSTDTWQHITATYNGTDMKIYVDGVKAASKSISGNPLIDNTNPITVGSPVGWGGPTSGIDGKTCEIRIYSRALTEREIQYLYQVGKRGRQITGRKSS